MHPTSGWEKGALMQTTNAEYFRRQAATCLRLAQFCRDLDVARGLFGLAHEFKTRAAEMDGGLQSVPLPAQESPHIAGK
jgi:hypothetical protein